MVVTRQMATWVDRWAPSHLVGGIVGLGFAIWLQIWTHVHSWPLNVGGKSMAAIPAIVPVSFELTVLLAGLATFATLLLTCRLRPTAQAPATQPHDRVNDDRFVVLVVEQDASFASECFRDLCDEIKPVEPVDIWRTT